MYLNDERDLDPRFMPDFDRLSRLSPRVKDLSRFLTDDGESMRSLDEIFMLDAGPSRWRSETG